MIPPTHSNQEIKGITMDNVCVWCSSSSELALHVLKECSFARAVLFSSNIRIGPATATCFSVCNWISHQATNLTSSQFSLFLMLVHSIGRSRNVLLWDNKVQNPATISHMARLQLYDFVKAQPIPKSKLIQSHIHWPPPPSRWIKITIDGAFCAATNTGGVCVVFHDDASNYVGGFARNISNVNSPKMAELFAARDGVSLALDQQW